MAETTNRRLRGQRPRKLTSQQTAQEHPTTDALILSQARGRFDAIYEAETKQRERERRELRFESGRQWEQVLENQRKLDNRPSLTMNRIPQFLHQVTNEQILSPVSMRVSPVDDRADIETAKVIAGLLRNIEQTSQADVAYRTAYKPSVGQGVGFLRVVTEYEDPWSFKQVVKIKRVRNRFSCYLDHTHQELDGSDANWGFVIERLSRSAFCQQYGMHPTQLDVWAGVGDTWITPTEVQVAEYFYREWVKEELALLADGTVRLSRETTKADIILQRRPTLLPVVWWLKINGYTILERTQWLGDTIPLVPVYGEEYDLDGEVEHSGMVRPLMDPQMMYNYMASAEAEAIGLAPRAPFIAAEGQLEGYEDYWRTANTRNWAFLYYKPITSGGVPVPPPQRNAVEPAVQAIAQSRLMAAEDMKATVGLYDASLGARSNEIAGIAIRERQEQGNLATAHYHANLKVAIRRVGMICLELIPRIYDTAQIARIIGEDGESEMVPLNQPFREESGTERHFDVKTGKYDVVISAGPSFATQRKEAAEKIDSLVKAYPPVMTVAGDYLVQSIDMPHSQQIAARLKTQVPPEALAATEQESPEDMVASLQNQVVQLSQDLKALDAYAQTTEGQLQQAGQQIALLQQQLTNKAQELVIKSRELDIKQRELDLHEREMLLDQDIAQQKVDLDVQKAFQNGTEAGDAWRSVP